MLIVTGIIISLAILGLVINISTRIIIPKNSTIPDKPLVIANSMISFMSSLKLAQRLLKTKNLLMR